MKTSTVVTTGSNSADFFNEAMDELQEVIEDVYN